MMIGRRDLLTVSALGLMLGSPAFGRARDPSDLYLPMLQFMEGRIRSPTDSNSEIFAQILASCGDESRSLSIMKKIDSYLTYTSDVRGCNSRDALEEIYSLAQSVNVVILNESHYISRGRDFADRLISMLRPLGYSIFAGEAVTPEMQRGFEPISLDWGTYTADPVYAEMLRHARQLGYSLASYEMRSGQKALGRDRAQAVNIKEILKKNPDEKVFVFCGYSHVLKVSDKEPRMAQFLRDEFGENPLCINQVEGFPTPPEVELDNLANRVSAYFNLRASACVTDAQGQPLASDHFRRGVDLAVFHPRVPNVKGRPGWWALNSDRSELEVSIKRPVESSFIVQAVAADDFAKQKSTVPSDQKLMYPGDKVGHLFLKPGSYAIVIETIDERKQVDQVIVRRGRSAHLRIYL